MSLSQMNRLRLTRMQPHARRHAEQLLWEVGAPLTVTSTRRSEAKNRAVGGVPNSFHLTGRAVDLTGDVETLIRASGLAWALRVGKGCTGPEEVVLEYLGGPKQHLHIAW